MPSKIRLQRRGKKGQPFYHIVIADGRAPRDGKFIEKIGTYNPLTKPADIALDFDRALYWLQNGSQPTDTARAILSHQGVMYKLHLLKGITKGALTQEQADARFEAWFREKQEKISNQVKSTEQESKNEIKKRLEAERKVNEARAADLAAKRLAELKMIESKRAAARKEEEPAAETEQEVTGEVEAATAEPVGEEEQPKAETIEEPAEDTNEPVAVGEEPAAEVTEPEAEAPVEEPSKESEAPAEKPSEEPEAPAKEPSKEEEAPEKAE